MGGLFPLRMHQDVQKEICGPNINRKKKKSNMALECTKPFDETRDASQQEEEEEHTDSIWKKLRLKELKKGFTSSTNMDFMILLNELSSLVVECHGD